MATKITYIRWSMTVIEMNGRIIVTDPVFRLLGFPIGPRQYTLDQMPTPDLVLISHRHFDHWDPWTMRRLDRDTPLIVRPRRIAADAHRWGYSQVQELAPWQKTQVMGFSITAVPAVHPGGEVGFVIQGDRTLYFGGDTSFDREIMADIGARFDLDAALLPVGGLRYLIWAGQIDPHQAVKAVQLLRPRIVIGIHWGGVPHLPPLIDMPGTPQKVAQLLAQAGSDVQVQGMTPLETVVLP